jgi:uncharacterized protein YjgD (DUF1641 family)
MARPIPLEIPPRDCKAELMVRLENAPKEHAEALLAGYELLQRMHDRGVLDFLEGAVGSSDAVLEVLVKAMNSPGSVQGIRNLVVIFNMFGSIDPDLLKAFTEAVPGAMQKTIKEPGKPGLWRLTQDFFWNADFRHGLAALNTLLEVFGRSLSEKKKNP